MYWLNFNYKIFNISGLLIHLSISHYKHMCILIFYVQFRMTPPPKKSDKIRGHQKVLISKKTTFPKYSLELFSCLVDKQLISNAWRYWMTVHNCDKYQNISIRLILVQSCNLCLSMEPTSHPFCIHTVWGLRKAWHLTLSTSNVSW